MEIKVNKTFLQELAVIPLKDRLKIEKFLFEEVKTYKRLQQIPNIGKLQGYSSYFKIRFGNYRAGVRLENKTIYFERILHRKDIYKYYPGR